MVPSIASTSMGPPAVVSDRIARRSSPKGLPAERERHRSPKRSSSRDRKEKRRHMKNGTGSEEDAAGGARVRDDWKGKKVSGPKESAFQYMYPIVDIPIPPALIQDAHRAADELMDTLLMRYVPQLNGVLISHRNICFLRSHARIDSDGAYSIAPAGLTCLVWTPKIGMRLEGEIKMSTPSHISLLVHGIFNASITSAHLPSNVEASSSGKDEQYRWHELDETEEVKVEEDEEGSAEPSNGMGDGVGEKSTGYWVNGKTGERLGAKDGKVVFTVVGMTVANHMLSVYGSLLRKPFSIPAPTYVPTLASTSTAVSIESARRVRFQDGHQTSTYDRPTGDDEGDSDDDDLPDMHSVSRPEFVREESKKKKRTKVGPRREGEASGSESEGEARREKKKRKKE